MADSEEADRTWHEPWAQLIAERMYRVDADMHRLNMTWDEATAGRSRRPVGYHVPRNRRVETLRALDRYL